MPKFVYDIDPRTMQNEYIFWFGWEKSNKTKKYFFLIVNNVEQYKKHVKMAQKWPKMSQNAHYLTAFNSF